MADKITLGSGRLYYTEFSKGVIPEVNIICVPENRIGYIKGGATIEYKPTYYEAKDDLGYVTKTIMTEEEATFKTGIMTFDGNTLKTLSDTGRVSEDVVKKMRTVLIGGAGNSTNQNYVLCFHHEDDVDGDKWVLIVGRNQAGFTLSFNKDTETVIDAEFKCQPQDEDGTLIKYIEEDNSIVSAG